MALTTQAYGLTDVGRKRPHNEDALLVDRALGLFIVADGMGGHAAGEVASERAAAIVRDAVAANPQPLADLARDPSQAHRAAAVALIEGAIQRACAEIHRAAEADPSRRGMGTTIVCVATAGANAVVGHVGDSRVYLVRGSHSHRLTEDHTLVAEQVKAGALTREQAQTSRYRSVITRAVGIHESVQVDTLVVDVAPGDRFLLCSDGLHGYLQDEEVAPLLASGPPQELPKRLVDLANERGGRDNITALVVSVEGNGTAAQDAAEARSRMDALRKIPIFRHLTYKEQTAVLSLATTRPYPAGAEIAVEGTPGEELFVVLRGRVTVEKGAVQIAELKPGGHFGEMGLVDGSPRSATCRAAEPTRVMVISRANLIHLMRREPTLAVKMLWSFVQVLSTRLRTTNAELSEAKMELAAVQSVHPFADE